MKQNIWSEEGVMYFRNNLKKFHQNEMDSDINKEIEVLVSCIYILKKQIKISSEHVLGRNSGGTDPAERKEKN